MRMFHLKSEFKPSPAQKEAVSRLLKHFETKSHPATLLGVTGSGKTFTMAVLIKELSLPTIVISHNKTLAAQLYTELKTFFPENAVCYFVSYYDYYQPEAYIPQTDTYIAKDASINEQIDRLRLQATSHLLSRKDVIIVATVSCIYGIGSPEEWQEQSLKIFKGQIISPQEVSKALAFIQYERNDMELSSGKFRLKGQVLEVFPPYAQEPVRVIWNKDRVDRIYTFDAINFIKKQEIESIIIFPAKFFVTSPVRLEEAIKSIKEELEERVKFFKREKKFLEAERLLQRTRYDLEMLKETGYCHGIENYSRHLSGRLPGEPPYCLMNYFPKNFLTIIDESHVTVPQLRGMWAGDFSRKKTLVEFGFRLPSAIDNRPLRFEEFKSLLDKVLFVSATPSEYEIKESKGVVVEQLIRPTGLPDPPVIVKHMKGVADDILKNIKELKKKNHRALIVTLTKKMAEDLSSFLLTRGIKSQYIHSDLGTLERIEILKKLRQGVLDCVVGVNLLREGLDLPEVSRVLILDADKEGFLRSKTSIIQIAGRAARNLESKVILYAEKITPAMKEAIEEMKRRRQIQIEYNRKHKIQPKTIVKKIAENEEFIQKLKGSALKYAYEDVPLSPTPQMIKALEEEMRQAAENLDFEMAIILRDKLKKLKKRI
ncbi:MAG: excinuclease ABC subunit UvrB [Elusimicrobia bacterium]|nr:excinuclease ABC subunit UvrB [Elusimicrobiota bacterium]